ncbi:MAG: glycine zipper 2TM domain-containing protein [Telluria sp.]
MEAIKTTTNRIHPLMAVAAASVIIVSLAGTAAITGALPSSNSAPSPQAAAMPMSQNGYGPAYPGAPAPVAVSNAYGQPLAQPGVQPVAQPLQSGYAQPVSAMYAQPVAAAVQPAPAPVVIRETIIREVPAKPAPRPRVVHTRYVQHDAPSYYTQAPRPAPQPNYIGIGTGAVIGGLIGNQVGGGNGKKLATVAGIIGGGMLGNQMINR